MASKKKAGSACPCGSGTDYTACCGPYHEGLAAPTAEALMRSRYAAYVLRLEPYLLATWEAGTRPLSLDIDIDDKTRWLGLEIKRREQTGEDSAIVEFVARYKRSGRAWRLHEFSRFVREAGRWFYVDGSFPEKGKR